jgi:hypothetical protein
MMNLHTAITSLWYVAYEIFVFCSVSSCLCSSCWETVILSPERSWGQALMSHVNPTKSAEAFPSIAHLKPQLTRNEGIMPKGHINRVTDLQETKFLRLFS